IPNVIKLPFTSQTPPVESSKKKKKPDHVFRDMEPPPDNASYSGAAKIDLFSFKYLGKKSSSTLRSKLIEEKSRRKNRFKLYRSQFDSDNKYWMYNNELAVLKNSIRTYNSNTR
ncbi:MAG: hypothetical protein JNL74_15940, partial [Fibrobacteres bacterium]|nr:hypothetical protein [Fibrobacterota bacterium]